jgi:FkbM family methyltransferase
MKTEREYATEIVARPKGRGTVIMELGAHHGHDTALLYDAAIKPVKYIAVEADPRNIPTLEMRVQPRPIEILHAAIWDRMGEIDLHLSHGEGAGSSSLRAPLKHLEHFPDIKFSGHARVHALPLDSITLYYAINHVDLIWCDIQGAERNMIAGGRMTLARTSWLLTECDRIEMYEGQATRDELLDLLGPHWELVAEWPENANLLLRNRRHT